jgi:nucleotidyltransferase/DNA polymerase involved in DNA repair
MDAFYVHVYVLDYPAEADIPLVIGGQPTARDVFASASYAARCLVSPDDGPERNHVS